MRNQFQTELKLLRFPYSPRIEEMDEGYTKDVYESRKNSFLTYNEVVQLLPMSEDQEVRIDTSSPPDVIVSGEAQILTNFEKMLESGKKILFATDFDKTISMDGPSKGEDPRDSMVDPNIRESMLKLQEAGIDLAVISARSARKIAQIMHIPGLQVVGTMGWETFHSDRNNPTDGTSLIHESFDKYQKPLTDILQEAREKFLAEDLHVETEDMSEAVELEYGTPQGGKVVLERKGVNLDYPEGILHTYNFNQVQPNERAVYSQHLKQYYEEAFEKAAEGHDDAYRLELMKKCGLLKWPCPPTDPGRFSVEIGPIAQRAKTGPIIQFMRDPSDVKRNRYFQGMKGEYAGIIYAGDHEVQDGRVFDATARVSRRTGELDAISLWIHTGETAERKNSARVHGVSENARIIEQMATIATAHKASAHS